MPAAVLWSSISRPSCAPGATSVTVPARSGPLGPDLTTLGKSVPDTDAGRGDPGTVEDDQERIRDGDDRHGRRTDHQRPAGRRPRRRGRFCATPGRAVSRSRSPRSRIEQQSTNGTVAHAGWVGQRAGLTAAIPRPACATSWRSPNMVPRGHDRCDPTRLSWPLRCPITSAISTMPD